MQQQQPPAPLAGNVKKSLAEIIKGVNAAEIVDLPMVADRFKNLYLTFHGSDAARFYEAEKFHFAKIVSASEGLRQADRLTLYGAWMDLCVHGISLDPMLKQAYLYPKGGKAVLSIQARGELMIRKREGQIKDAENPVLVFPGDHFVHGRTMKGERFVEHSSTGVPESTEAIACYFEFTKADGKKDVFVLTRPELELLRAQSDTKNGPSWTKNFNGMFVTKTIKHAFKGYEIPRSLGRTKFSELETSAEDLIPGGDLYGIGDPPQEADVTASKIGTPPAGAPPPPPEVSNEKTNQAKNVREADKLDLNF